MTVLCCGVATIPCDLAIGLAKLSALLIFELVLMSRKRLLHVSSCLRSHCLRVPHRIEVQQLTISLVSSKPSRPTSRGLRQTVHSASNTTPEREHKGWIDGCDVPRA